MVSLSSALQALLLVSACVHTQAQAHAHSATSVPKDVVWSKASTSSSATIARSRHHGQHWPHKNYRGAHSGNHARPQERFQHHEHKHHKYESVPSAKTRVSTNATASSSSTNWQQHHGHMPEYHHNHHQRSHGQWFPHASAAAAMHHEPKHAHHEPKPVRHEPKHAHHEPKPVRHETKHAHHEPKRAHHEPKHVSRPTAATRLSPSRVQPSSLLSTHTQKSAVPSSVVPKNDDCLTPEQKEQLKKATKIIHNTLSATVAGLHIAERFVKDDHTKQQMEEAAEIIKAINIEIVGNLTKIVNEACGTCSEITKTINDCVNALEAALTDIIPDWQSNPIYKAIVEAIQAILDLVKALCPSSSSSSSARIPFPFTEAAVQMLKYAASHVH